MSHSYDAIVIGSGLGGLTAGALYARTGAKVLLLERNESFGGAATTYHRGALTVEASLHETTHPDSPSDPKHDVFEALDLLEDVDLVPVEALHEIRSPVIGAPFVLPHGLETVEAALAERFPHQRKNARAFLRHLRRTLQLQEFTGPGRGPLWRIAHAAEFPLDLWATLRDMKSSLTDVFERFFGDDEAIKFALAANLPYFADDPDTFWWLGYAYIQGDYLSGGGYYIKGGSQTLSDRLAEIIREEGGETLNSAPAIAVEIGSDGEAKGVRYRTADDAETLALAPVIFANAAPHVIETLLPSEQRETFMKPFRDRPLSISLLSATFGLNRPPSEFGVSSYSTMLMPDWMERLSDYEKSTALLGETPGERMPAICAVDYNHIDSGLTDGDVYPLNIVCPDRYENWRDLSDEAYQQHKEAWTEAILRRLDEEWPGIAGAVVEKVVATARSMREHLNTPGGAIYGFALRPPEEFPKGPPESYTTPIKGLWLASAYSGFGGFTGSIYCGAGAARAALREQQA